MAFNKGLLRQENSKHMTLAPNGPHSCGLMGPGEQQEEAEEEECESGSSAL